MEGQFVDRREAGEMLAARLQTFAMQDVVVLRIEASSARIGVETTQLNAARPGHLEDGPGFPAEREGRKKDIRV